jgi:hypothetical protein
MYVGMYVKCVNVREKTLMLMQRCPTVSTAGTEKILNALKYARLQSCALQHDGNVG